MKKVIVASKNPVKIQCSRLAFEKAFPQDSFEFVGVSVPSGVSDQPMTDSETLQGAINRTKNVREAMPEADFWIGIEGGVDRMGEQMDAFAWVNVESASVRGQARTATFQLPPQIVALIDEGMELGHADDLVFKRENSKHKSGAVGILTHGLIDRAQYYEPAVVLALIPLTNPKLY